MRISHPDAVLKGMLSLAGSKSESNRALMIQAYLGQKCDIFNLSDSNDTVLLSRLLGEIEKAVGDDVHTVDCADAGTVCRFLTTYLAQRKGKWLLTGNERLRQRPIAPLVDALRCLGADISYSCQEGQLPLIINGNNLKPRDIEIDASQSSQFVSSLLLMLPTLGKETSVRLVGELGSLPYIDMTIAIMNRFGAEVSRNGDRITVSPSGYSPCRYVVSPDWSSASYWLEAVALSEECRLILRNYRDNSLQGDEIAVEMFGRLGVSCSFSSEGMLVDKTGSVSDDLEFDFLRCPDLFPAVVATCAALNRKAVFTGVRNLRYKESDRVEAMIEELSKAGARFTVQADRVVLEKGLDARKTPVFMSHNDHRVVMSLSMLALKLPYVEIEGADAVKKSYKDFWKDMEKLDFQMP